MSLLKISGEIKNPRLEDNVSIMKYSAKYNDPYDRLWIADSKDHFNEIMKRSTGIPEVLIYDKAFRVLQNAHGESCQKLLISFFADSLKHEYNKVNDSSYIFIKDRIREIDTKNVSENVDYIIVYSWVKWLPKLSKNILESMKELKASGKYRICFVSLNNDWQKGQFEKAPNLNGRVKNSGSALAKKK